MSEEGKGRKTALVRFKAITGTLALLTVILLLFAGLGIEFYDSDISGPPYYLGGFIVGAPALLVTFVNVSILAKAVGRDANDAHLKDLAPRISCQYTVTMFLLPACFIGSILTGVGGFSGDEDDRAKGSNRFLATVLLLGIILTFCVAVGSMWTVCMYGRYFGVIISKRGRRAVVVANITPDGRSAGGTGGVTVQNNVNVFTTNVNNQRESQLEQQNRLLQQQLHLQQQLLNQQQQQQHGQGQFSGGMYPPPPPYHDADPAYQPTAPPPPYSKGS